jgi:hypothetical protein
VGAPRAVEETPTGGHQRDGRPPATARATTRRTGGHQQPHGRPPDGRAATSNRTGGHQGRPYHTRGGAARRAAGPWARHGSQNLPVEGWGLPRAMGWHGRAMGGTHGRWGEPTGDGGLPRAMGGSHGRWDGTDGRWGEPTGDGGNPRATTRVAPTIHGVRPPPLVGAALVAARGSFYDIRFCASRTCCPYVLKGALTCFSIRRGTCW